MNVNFIVGYYLAVMLMFIPLIMIIKESYKWKKQYEEEHKIRENNLNNMLEYFVEMKKLEKIIEEKENEIVRLKQAIERIKRT